MSARMKLAGGGVVAVLLVLALLGGAASPGFSIAAAPVAAVRSAAKALLPPHPRRQAPPAIPQGPTVRASGFALADIPGRYLGLYAQAAHACPALSWQVLAGIGKVETNHGRANLPGVKSGVNAFGCCAGPMQFNVTNGPPSTWDAWAPKAGANVYDPADAIPAAAHKLCADGLATPGKAARDPCPTVLGTPAQHQALYAYNHACWYAHQVLTLAARYTTTTSPPPADPFTLALTQNPHLATTPSHGCDPKADLANPQLDLRIQSLLSVLADRWTIRLSCIRTGHSHNVAGTTRTSLHTVWRAVDIDQVDHHPVGPNDPATRALMGWLDHLQGPLRPSEVGGPLKIAHRPYFTNEGHQHHIHIGYHDPL
jgi:hypothetical protein